RANEERGRSAEAAECWRQAVAVDPENRDAEYRFGQDLVRRGKENEARAHLDRAEALRTRQGALKALLDRQMAGGQDAGAFERLGHLSLESGLLFEAKGWFEQTIRIDPTRSEAQVAFAQIVVPPDPPLALPRMRSAAQPLARAEVNAKPSSSRVRFEDTAK